MPGLICRAAGGHGVVSARFRGSRAGVAPSSGGKGQIFVGQGLGDRSLHAHRPNPREIPRGGVAGDDGLVACPFQQVTADAVVQRSDEGQPRGRQPRAQQRDPQHHAAKTLRTGVCPHHAAVGDPVRPADLVHRAALRDRGMQRGQQISDDVFDGDRLRQRLHPARGDHHGQAVDQATDHLERHRAASEDHRSAELDDLRSALAEHPADVLPAGEVVRQPVGRTPQPSEIDDAPDARCPGRLSEVPRRR